MPLYKKAIPLSDSRARLKAMIEAKQAAIEAGGLIAASITKLQSTSTRDVDAAQAALARLDSDHEAAVASWARGSSEDPAPALDAALHAGLRQRLDDARAKVDATKRIEAAFSQEYASEMAKVPRILAAMKMEIVDILIADAAPLLAAFAAANAQLARDAERLRGLRDTIINLAEGIGRGESARPAFVKLEGFDNQLTNSLAMPGTDVPAARAARANLASLVNQLHADASATLDFAS